MSGRHQWISNCNTYSVRPETLKEGKRIDNDSFDEPLLELVEGGIVKGKTIEKARKTGGQRQKF